MATKYLNTKIITCIDTAANWAKSSKILLDGEMAIEKQATGVPKVKIGDGSHTFSQLGYATMTPAEIEAAISAASENTTYDLAANASATNNNVKITLSGSDSSADDVYIKGTNGATVTSDASGNIIVDAPVAYVHPTSGITAGTYVSVTVDAEGHATAGSTTIDASAIGSGTIDIARLPEGALERLVVVADTAARLALTDEDVQLGDTVKEEDTGLMYFVKDESALGTEAAFEQYTAGAATSVPWNGVTGKPETFPPSAHTHQPSEVGLGNLTNDAQVKGLASGTTAGNIVTWGADGYTVADSGFTIATSVPANAVFTDTTYDDFVGATESAAGAAGLVPAPRATDDSRFLRGDGSWADVDVADEKVMSVVNTDTKAYLVASTSGVNTTGTLIKDTGVYLDTTAGSLVATSFTGALTGNASTATALAASKNFSITGGATAAAVAFDGSGDVALNVTSLDATKLNLASGDVLVINGGDAEVPAGA